MTAAERKAEEQKAEQRKAQVLALREEGKTYAEIAEVTGLKAQDAVDSLNLQEVYHVNTLRAIEAEAMFARLQVDKQGRINRLAALQDRLSRELESRDLTDLPTDKLVTLLIKTSEALKGEVFNPVIQTTTKQEKDARQWGNW